MRRSCRGDAGVALTWASEDVVLPQALREAPALPKQASLLSPQEQDIASGNLAQLDRRRRTTLVAIDPDSAKALQHMFFAERTCSKVPGVSAKDAVPVAAAGVVELAARPSFRGAPAAEVVFEIREIKGDP